MTCPTLNQREPSASSQPSARSPGSGVGGLRDDLLPSEGVVGWSEGCCGFCSCWLEDPEDLRLERKERSLPWAPDQTCRNEGMVETAAITAGSLCDAGSWLPLLSHVPRAGGKSLLLALRTLEQCCPVVPSTRKDTRSTCALQRGD